LSATHSLAGFDLEEITASEHEIYSKAIPGIQNGNPDGLALVVNGVVKQFISYEGSFTATAGAAMGMTSVDIGVSQNQMVADGLGSLILAGTGGSAADFSWTRILTLAHSPGFSNQNQTFTAPPQPQGLAIDDLAVTFLTGDDTDGDGSTDSDEAVFGTDPTDASSRFTMSLTLPSPTLTRLVFPTKTGRSYAVETSDGLASWEETVVYPGTGAERVAEFPISPAEPARFYRIRVTLDQ
jgi:hypothetical protein